MVDVIFFVDNKNIQNVDCRNIVISNPGIGGTEYMMFLISYLLTARDNGINVVLVSTAKAIVPDVMKNIVVNDIYQGYQFAKDTKCKYFIYKHVADYLNSNLFEKLCDETKLIPWCHNFCDYKSLRFYANNSSTARIIAVGREQMDLYRDHKAFLKSDYIYNCVPVSTITENEILKTSCRENIVTYVGSIVPEKGFALLAKAWPTVLQSIPDAQLYVIGSGKLYNNSAKLGKWGVAEETFEKRFMRYLAPKGKILSSVHFCGVLGNEKKEILLKTKVGVPNPSGLTETFGITAVEFQIMGATVVTKKCAGYVDTVFCGILYNDTKKLADAIINQLVNPTIDYQPVISTIKHKFSIDTIVEDWELLLTKTIMQNTYLHDIKLNNNYNHKKVKEFLFKLKSKYTILYSFLPSFGYLCEIDSKVIEIKRIVKLFFRCVLKK